MDTPLIKKEELEECDMFICVVWCADVRDRVTTGLRFPCFC